MHEDRFLLSVACCVENSFRFVSLVYTRLKLFCRFSVQVDMIRLSTWSSHGVFFITSRGYGFGRISGISIHFKNFQFICLSLPVGRQQYNNSTFWILAPCLAPCADAGNKGVGNVDMDIYQADGRGVNHSLEIYWKYL